MNTLFSLLPLSVVETAGWTLVHFVWQAWRKTLRVWIFWKRCTRASNRFNPETVCLARSASIRNTDPPFLF